METLEKRSALEKKRGGLSLGVLSWRAHDTLKKTLATYRALLPLVDEAVVFFNAVTAEDRAIASAFGFRAEGVSDNLGILGGTVALVRKLHEETVLLVQNDNPVNVPPSVLQERLMSARTILEEGKANMVRVRDRFDPSFSCRKKYLRYWPDDGCPDTWDRKIRRMFRPLKARRMAGRAPAVLKDPVIRHPDLFTRIDQAWVGSSQYINYSDQPFLARKDFVMQLLEWAEAHQSGMRTLNGHAVAEVILNSGYWQSLDLKVAITDGFFAHLRHDDSFRPGHKAYNASLNLS